MSKELFIVSMQAEFEMAVMAESVDDARRIAIKNADDELSNILDPWDARPRKETLIKWVPEEMRDSLPWGSDDSRTVRQILEAASGAPGEKEPVE